MFSLFAVCGLRESAIPKTLRERSNPPDDSEDEEDIEIEYDVYGWFRFEEDKEEVKRLDRQWVPIHLAATAAEFAEKVEEFEERLVDTRKEAGLC